MVVKKNIKKKQQLRLVREKDIKKYDKVIIDTGDKGCEYDLVDWDILWDDDGQWLDMVRRDKTAQHSFNVDMIVSIICSSKPIKKEIGGGLQPVA